MENEFSFFVFQTILLSGGTPQGDFSIVKSIKIYVNL